jgi:cyclopropane fatty-acyl-phospholipid synthase-like methyltransferase
MLERARFDAPIVASRVPVRKGATSLLDVAGSHGLFGAAICRRYPTMRATVLDLPQAVSHARALASAERIDDVVTFREGDLFASDLGSSHDVVLLFNILHHFTEDRILSILDRVRAAMRGGGTVAAWEIEAPKRGSRATAGDGVALFFRLTSTAGAYHGDQYAEWMRRSGFDRVAVVRPAMSPGNVLVTARR